jgi:hypothetical protein
MSKRVEMLEMFKAQGYKPVMPTKNYAPQIKRQYHPDRSGEYTLTPLLNES